MRGPDFQGGPGMPDLYGNGFYAVSQAGRPEKPPLPDSRQRGFFAQPHSSLCNSAPGKAPQPCCRAAGGVFQTLRRHAVPNITSSAAPPAISGVAICTP